jgi:NAD+ synthase (glutamine-hydrolysing)
MSRTLTLAIAQIRPVKGNYQENLRLIGRLVAEVARHDPPPQVIQFPETATSGYFVEGGVRDVAVTAGTLAADLDRVTAEESGGLRSPIDVVVGFYERWGETLYNSAAYIRLGEGNPRVVHVHRKAFLPTYGMFDEERFVERGHDLRAFDTPWGRAGLLVCEDAWHSLSGTLLALDGAQLIFVLSAAPARGIAPRSDDTPGPASAARWDRLVRDIADEHGVFVSFSNLVGSEGGKMFAGCSVLFGPHGDLRLRAPAFDEAVAIAELDFADVGRARADTPLLADLRTALPHLRRQIDAVETQRRTPLEFDGAQEKSRSRGAPPKKENKATAEILRHQSVAIPIISSPGGALGGPPPLEIDPELVERWLVRFLRDEMSRRGMRRVVVGLSGGVDSAVTTWLAASALGAENVFAIRLPYRTSSAESLEHAQLVIDLLGIPSKTVDISGAVDGYLCLEPDAEPGRRGNVMARVRMTALFDQSAVIQGLPLGTGNKSERLLGYFTWHADDSPPINPLGDLFKTQVWTFARHLGIPEAIVGKPATADLVAGQTDEGDFGISYAKADPILNWLIAGYTPLELEARGFDAAEVALVHRRLAGTHWKRRLPTVALLSQSAIGESYLRPVDY